MLQIISSHNMSSNITPEIIKTNGNNHWLVNSETDKNIKHKVEKIISSCKNCLLRCDKCQICLQKCICMNNVVHFNICKHIHACAKISTPVVTSNNNTITTPVCNNTLNVNNGLFEVSRSNDYNSEIYIKWRIQLVYITVQI